MSDFLGLTIAGASTLSNALLRSQEIALQRQALESGILLKAKQYSQLGFNPNEVKTLLVGGGSDRNVKLSNMHNDVSVVNSYNMFNPVSNGFRKKIKSFNDSVKIYNTIGESHV
uniref:Minor structural protein n=1 Tax=Hare calicivirus Australia-2 TaxID=2569937 RepID=A0A4D6IA17_9CALI|nr:minor structural protein [Hare calicivirus Australia-2]